MQYRDHATRVADALSAESITYINPLPELIERDNQERTYYFLNIHFTPAGNEALADAALPVLQERLLERFAPDTHERADGSGDSGS